MASVSRARPAALAGERPGMGSPGWRQALIVLPPLLYLLVVLGGPLVALVAGAASSGLGTVFGRLLAPHSLGALWLTLQLSAGAVAVNTVGGLLLAWVLVRQRFPGRAVVNGLLGLPFAVSPVVVGLALLLLFGRGGALAWLPAALGIQIVFAWPAMLLATVFVSLPFVAREVMPVLRELGEEAEQAAATLGASPWQTFWRVTLPGLRWGLLYGITLTVARTLGEFGAVLVVSGSIRGRTETATLAIFAALDERDVATAYALACALAAASFLLLGAMQALQRRVRAREGG